MLIIVKIKVFQLVKGRCLMRIKYQLIMQALVYQVRTTLAKIKKLKLSEVPICLEAKKKKQEFNGARVNVSLLNCVGKMINDRLSSIDVNQKMSFRKERKFRLSHSDFLKLKVSLFKKGMKELHDERVVSSLYFDTLGLFFYKASEEGTLPRRKFRVRWYNDDKS